MTDEQYSVILFLSVSHALKAEKLLKKKELNHKLIPVPRHISSECGVCIRITSDLEAAARETLTGEVPFEAIESLAHEQHR